jgi:DNA-formamidopyrimidine glycosylase
MPEGPEVLIITNCLKDFIGHYIKNITWTDQSRYKKGLSKYDEQQFPSIIENVFSKGKQIFFQLKSKKGDIFYLNSFLGMTGKWQLKEGNHSNLFLTLDTTTLFFDDVRHLGGLTILNEKELQSKLNKLGPDILRYAISLHGEKIEHEEITKEKWKEKFRNKRIENWEICKFLLDQSKFSGIGNYLKSDILFESHISPNRLLKNLTDKELEKLRENALKIIYESYKEGGLTIRDYVDLYGNKGRYNPKIYGNPGENITKSKCSDGRTTYWNKDIQK